MKTFTKQLLRTLLWKAVHRLAAIENPTIVAVTGAVGKTSTKEAIALVLEQSGKPVRKSIANLNTDIGVPLSILGYHKVPSSLGARMRLLGRLLLVPQKPYNHPFYVLEYSADHPGDIGFLTHQLPPQDAVITQIVPAHMQAYASFDDLVTEKMTLVKDLKDQGVAILNADDPKQKERSKDLKNVIWYGLREQAGKQPGVWGHDLEFTKKGWKFRVSFVRPKGMDAIGAVQFQTFAVQTRVLGKHHLYSLLAAAAIGMQEHVPSAKIKAALEAYKLPPGRGGLIDGQRGMSIIDDTYNASPEAVKQGLDMLQELRTPTRRSVVVLGNMNELGEMAESLHKEVAAYAANKADFLVFIGPFGSVMAKEAEKAGHLGHRSMSFLTPEQFIDRIDQVVKRDDLLYIKGSQNGVRLERVVKKLMAHPEEAATLLVRQ